MSFPLIFEAERLKYKNFGLFHYCLDLGKALESIALNDDSLELLFYTYSNNHYYSEKAKYVNAHAYHKFFHYFKSPPKIWHSTYQTTPFMPKSPKIKIILTIHDLNYLREKPIEEHEHFIKKIKNNIERSESVVFISNFVKDEVLQNFDLSDKNISVIYNGNPVFGKHTEKPKLVPLGLDLSRPFLYSVCAINRKKNLHILPYLLLKNDFNLVLSGIIDSKEYYREIRGVAEKIGVSDRVFFTGAVSNAHKNYYLENCHLFCFPSITEGFGLPVVEAMHFGANIIASNGTSLPEIGGDVIHYFDSFQEDYLVQLGKEIPDWKISAQEKEKIKERSRLFDWNTSAQLYWDEYKKLI